MVNIKEAVILSKEPGLNFTAGGTNSTPNQESDECKLTKTHTACQISHH